MKIAAAGVTVLLFALAGTVCAQAQTPSGAPQRMQVAPATVDLNSLLQQVQQVTGSANLNIAKLRIEKWKTDSEQKKQMQQIADSLQKNISNAVPGLIIDVENNKGSVLASFKLYHNLNVLYEFLSGLADAAGAFGKREEYEPLAADAAALDTARQNLSTYVEQAAGRLEAASRAAATPPTTTQVQKATVVPGKKIIVDDEDTPKPKKKSSAKSTKKKTSSPPASPSPTPAGQSASSPH
jgi:hypothetical protein